MKRSLLDVLLPELKQNKEPKPIDTASSQTIAKPHVIRIPDLRRGKQVSERCSQAFWDSLNARSDNDLQDLLEWSKQMSQTNCGWQEYRLSQAFIESVKDILTERMRSKGCV